jgi:hypothetical protein
MIRAMPPLTGTRLVTNTGGLRGVVVFADRASDVGCAGSGQALKTGIDFLTPR